MDPALAIEVAALSKRRYLDELIEKGDSNIQLFYENATIFVTGGTGFLGKHMIEKLFRSCNVKKIIMLIRAKKGKTIEQRLSEIVQDSVYEDLRKKQPEFVNKLFAVNGDITQLNLGLSQEDWNSLSEEVEIIFHGAATINFEEPMVDATITNIRGTKQVLLLGKCCKKLKSFVHISTAYSYATRSRFNSDVKEEFYDPPIPPETMINLAETVDKQTLDDITPALIKNWPNTYAFTKAIAEELVRSMSSELPICIVRPAIVICCYREPSPGWIDSSCAFGPSGLVLGVGMGIVHVMHVAENIHLDLVPADYTNNAIIAAAWDTAERRSKGDKELKIFTVTGARNPISIRHMTRIMTTKTRCLVSPKAVWYCGSFVTSNSYMHLILTWLFHLIPAYLIDFACMLVGKKRRFVKLYQKVYTLSSVFMYFLNNQWKFCDKNLVALKERLSNTDKEMYNFDMANIDWEELICIWYLGLRKYVINDKLTGTEYGVKKQFWLKLLNYIVVGIYMYLWWTVLRWCFSAVNNIFQVIV